MAKQLKVNEPHIGWFFDGLPDDVTPPTAAMLMDDGQRIQLTLPWVESWEGPPSQIQRWFGRGPWPGEEPTAAFVAMPTALGFVDSRDHVVLIGCRSNGYHCTLGGAGEGHVGVDAVVFGTDDLRYEHPEDVRSLIPGLASWLGVSSVTTEINRGDGPLTVTVTAQSSPAILLGGDFNMELVPSWRANDRPAGGNEVRDEVWIVTSNDAGEPWRSHARAHQRFADLLKVVAWQPIGFSQVQVSLGDDGWQDVQTHRMRGMANPIPLGGDLFRLKDLADDGLLRWLALRESYDRAFSPILGTLDFQGGYLEADLSQVSVGLEALGYQLCLDAGETEDAARREWLQAKLQRILDELPFQPVRDDWPRRAADVYNGLKHANRELPDSFDLSMVWREDIVVFRAWVAQRLGMSGEKLKEALSTDRMVRTLAANGLGANVFA